MCEYVWSSQYEWGEFRWWVEPEAFSVTSGIVRTWFWVESISIGIEQKLRLEIFELLKEVIGTQSINVHKTKEALVMISLDTPEVIAISTRHKNILTQLTLLTS